MSQELRNVKSILGVLPNTNWFQTMEDELADHKFMGDSGIYDLFLHKRDVSFSVPELHEWLERSGIALVDFSVQKDRIALSLHQIIHKKELSSSRI